MLLSSPAVTLGSQAVACAEMLLEDVDSEKQEQIDELLDTLEERESAIARHEKAHAEANDQIRHLQALVETAQSNEAAEAAKSARLGARCSALDHDIRGMQAAFDRMKHHLETSAQMVRRLERQLVATNLEKQQLRAALDTTDHLNELLVHEQEIMATQKRHQVEEQAAIIAQLDAIESQLEEGTSHHGSETGSSRPIGLSQGLRVVYSIATLQRLSNSPLSLGPPVNFPMIKGVTMCPASLAYNRTYNKGVLMALRDSPLSQGRPSSLPVIKGVTFAPHQLQLLVDQWRGNTVRLGPVRVEVRN